MKALFRNNKVFFIPYLVFLVSGLVFMICNSRAETHLIINSYYNSFLDTISPYLTALGDGWTSVVVILFLLLIKYRYALLTGISFIVASLLVQLFRQTIFHGWPRPVKFFEGVHQLHLVPGVTIRYFNTFPSGHTATAFALFFSLSVLVKNNFLKLIFFILALAVAYSRVYLSQHFFGDVYGGSLIGMFSVFVAYYFILKIKKSWPERSLQTIFKRQ